jgi:hypothetical protein
VGSDPRADQIPELGLRHARDPSVGERISVNARSIFAFSSAACTICSCAARSAGAGSRCRALAAHRALGDQRREARDVEIGLAEHGLGAAHVAARWSSAAWLRRGSMRNSTWPSWTSVPSSNSLAIR